MRAIALGVLLLGGAICWGSSSRAAQSGPSGVIPIHVSETAGLRRFGYPVTARVTFPRGSVMHSGQIALERNGQIMRGVQYDGMERWPDGSLRDAWLHFNLSPGPHQKERFLVRFGPGVSHPDPGEGVVQTTAAGYLVRNTYLLPAATGTKNPPFLQSIRYGTREFLRNPATWKVRQRLGAPLPALLEHSRVVSPGPVNAVVEFTGHFGTPAGPAYRMVVAQPNSKSWFQANLELENPKREELTVELTLPYLVEKLPALYDLGAGSWVYGALKFGETATMEIDRSGGWRLLTQPAGSVPPSVYAASSDVQPRSEGWGHLIDGAPGGRAVAFGSPELAGGRMSGGLQIGASGEITMSWNVERRKSVRITAYSHHVNDPVHVSAATSPAAMLHPLQVSVGRVGPAR